MSSALVLVLAACGGSDDGGLATVDEVPSSSADESARSGDDTTVTAGEPDATGPTSEPPVPDAVTTEPAAPAPEDAGAGTTLPAISISPNANPDLVAATTVPTPGANDLSGFDLDPDSASVRGAVEDLADRLSIETSAVTVVSARAVTWPDSSLGCPIPGMQYLQVLTDGTEVVLEAGGETHRSTGGSPLTRCEQPPRPADG